MNDKNNWPKLARAARQAPAEPLPEVPFGFTTRVVARWQSSAQTAMPTLWEWFSVRSLLVACGVMLVSLTLNYDVLSESWSSAVPLSQNAFEMISEP